MCDSCLKRAERLRELAERFRQQADDCLEPLFQARLRRTAVELWDAADALADVCGADDVVWVDDEDGMATPAAAPALRRVQ